MRGRGPLHEGHLAEAVRRGIITDDQREALVAMARSESIDANVSVPDLRWTVVVQGIAAALAVLVPGATLLAQIGDVSEPILLASSAFCALLFGGLAWLARDRGWGRVPASIFSAAIAPYAGGLAMFALDLVGPGVLGPGRVDAMLSGQLTSATYVGTLARLFIAGAGVAIATSTHVARARRNGPVCSVAAACLTPIAYAVMWLVTGDAQITETMKNSALAAAIVVGITLAWRLRAKLRQGGVDGASWFELGVFAPAGIVLFVRLWDHAADAGTWLALSAAVAVGGVRARRWTYQLVGALALLTTTLVGLRHDPLVTRGGALVAVCAVLAIAAHEIRRSEARRAGREAPTETLTFWE